MFSHKASGEICSDVKGCGLRQKQGDEYDAPSLQFRPRRCIDGELTCYWGKWYTRRRYTKRRLEREVFLGGKCQSRTE